MNILSIVLKSSILKTVKEEENIGFFFKKNQTLGLLPHSALKSIQI